jgi:hypothetical protein
MKKKTIEESIMLGLYLKSQKDVLPHGAFLPMIEREFGFSCSTACRYMRTAKSAVRVVESMRHSKAT